MLLLHTSHRTQDSRASLCSSGAGERACRAVTADAETELACAAIFPNGKEMARRLGLHPQRPTARSMLLSVFVMSFTASVLCSTLYFRASAHSEFASRHSNDREMPRAGRLPNLMRPPAGENPQRLCKSARTAVSRNRHRSPRLSFCCRHAASSLPRLLCSCSSHYFAEADWPLYDLVQYKSAAGITYIHS